MATCITCNETEEQKRNRQIQKDLVNARKDIKRTVKLLLLGAGDSGKSTIAKQMKIIHLDGFNEEERMGYKTTIANNILTATRTLLHQANKFGYILAPENEAKSMVITSIPRDQEAVVTKEIGEVTAALWRDDAIKKTFDRSNEYQLNDSTQYYMEAIARIAEANYVPTEQDVLRSRVKTTGVLETMFEVEDILLPIDSILRTKCPITHSLIDGKYDLKLYEDNETNRMHESLQLFKELCNARWFTNTPFILFLNKKDLFEEKIKKVPLTVCFPDYGGEQTFQAASQFISEKFRELNQNREKTVYTHMTCATDTTNIIIVFNAVRDILLNDALVAI